ncbi:MAG TPA: hypothetical protein PK509_16340 [Catalimonadaceae bacterium]|nr:hypothetical protein [Catalimonadaceae bacterium]
MKTNPYHFLIFFSLLLFSACSKKSDDASPASLNAELTSSNRSWRISAATISPKYVDLDGNEIDNYFADFMGDCEKDNYVIFTSDGKIGEFEADNVCSGVLPYTEGTFTLTNGDKTINVVKSDSTYAFTVVSYTKSELKVSVKVMMEDENEEMKEYTITYTYSAITTPTSSSPILITGGASDITQTSFKVSADIKAQGKSAITARGIVWNTSSSPTIALSTKTNDGSGTGAFTGSITGLVSNRTYYVRSYATNSEGTVYGNQLKVKTAGPPLTALGLQLVDKTWKLTDYIENGTSQLNPMDCINDDSHRFSSNYTYVTTDLGIKCQGSTGTETGNWSMDGTNFTWDGEEFKNLTITATTMTYENKAIITGKFIYTKQ